MARRALAISCVVAISLAWPVAAGPPQTRSLVSIEHVTMLRKALAAYAEGDDLAVEALLRTRDGIASTAALEAVFGRPAEWTRTNAAFLAEMAVAAPLSNPGKLGALRIGRQLAISRVTLPGQDPAEDRFEILWHQLAVGLLQDLRLYPSQLDYLDAIAPRFNAAALGGATLHTRFVLARAIASSGFCCPIQNDPVRVIIMGADRRIKPRVTFETAAALFAFAATDPKLAPEALIRGAALQFNEGRFPEALILLDRAPADHGDPLLDYAHALTRARTLDLLSRPGDSLALDVAAREEFPTAQIPAIGQAAALLRTGHPAEAVRVATEARQMPPDTPDPWADFLKADARFVKDWLAELRTLPEMTPHCLVIAAMSAAALLSLASQQTVFRTRADVVAIDVAVQDGRKPVVTLTKDDFELRDNGVLQTIADFEREKLPLDVTITIDLSGSMTAAKLASIERAVAQVGQAMRDGDRSAVLTFKSVVTEERPMQPPPIALRLASNSGTTSIVDALLLALISEPLPDRRQLGLFMTDGEDSTSVFDVPTTMETAKYASTQMSFVVVRESGEMPKGAMQTLFRAVAETTGGELIQLAKDADLSRAFLAAVENFRTSYVLRYSPKGVSARGWHDIQVKTKQSQYTVRARRGYWGDR